MSVCSNEKWIKILLSKNFTFFDTVTYYSHCAQASVCGLPIGYQMPYHTLCPAYISHYVFGFLRAALLKLSKCQFDVCWGHQGTLGCGWGCTGGPCRSSESVSVGYNDTNAAGGGAAVKWVTWSGDSSRGSTDAQFRSITLHAPSLCVKPWFIHNSELQQVVST